MRKATKTQKTKITLASLYALIHSTRDSLERSLERSIKQHIGALRDETNARFDSMERLQRKMAVRLVSMERRLDDNGAMLASLQTRMDTVYGLIEQLSGHTARLEQEYVMITEALRRLEKRFDRLEAERLDARITELEARVSTLESA
jgi:TolA-binding protein